MFVKLMLPAIRDSKSEDLAAALGHAESDGLVFAASARNNLLTSRAVHVAGFAADERFIDFHFTSKLRRALVLHRFANTVKHEPSGFLSQSEIPSDFVAAHAVLAIRNEPHGREPLAQGD